MKNLALATSADDGGTVILWDVSDPAAPQPLGAPLADPSNSDWVYEVAFAYDRYTLAPAGRPVRLWNLTGLTDLRDHAMERACAITGGGLSQAEWDRYVAGLEYVNVCKNVTGPR